MLDMTSGAPSYVVGNGWTVTETDGNKYVDVEETLQYLDKSIGEAVA